jgi:hypothetical protein
LGWAIYLNVDRLGLWWTGSLMEKSAFTRANLFDVRVIMTIIHVLMEELLCQAVMGWILVLECPQSDACGCLWLRLVQSDIKLCCFPRTQLQGRLPSAEKPSERDCWGPGYVLSHVMSRSYSRRVGGKIPLARGHRDGRKDRYRLGPGLVLFRLVVSPLSSESSGTIPGMG